MSDHAGDNGNRNIQRDPRKACLSLEAIGDTTLPIEFLNGSGNGKIHALLINGSASGCCLLCDRKTALPDNAFVDFFEENNELWRFQTSFDIKWKKEDISINYSAYGMVVTPASERDRFVWKELNESLLSGERQFVCCILQPV